jgi:hypothetical protein
MRKYIYIYIYIYIYLLKFSIIRRSSKYTLLDGKQPRDKLVLQYARKKMRGPSTRWDTTKKQVGFAIVKGFNSFEITIDLYLIIKGFR